MKRIISILLVAGMNLMLIAGCGNGADQAKAQENSGSQENASQENASQENASQENSEQQNTTQESGSQESGSQESGSQESGSQESDSQESGSQAQSDVAAAYAESLSMPLNKYSAEWDCSKAGFCFTVPEEMRAYKGQLYPSDSGEAVYGSGVYEGYINYLARSDEEQMAFDAYLRELESKGAIDEQTQQEYEAKMTEYVGNRNVVAMVILGIEKEKSLDDVLSGNYLSFPVAETGKIGSAGNYNFYYVLPDYSQYEDLLREEMTEEFYGEFRSIMENAEQLVPCFTLKEPEADDSETKGKQLSFTAKDLDGNTVTSEELFGDYKVTMINIWATWCGPCRNELAKLEEFNKELAGKGCRVIGICHDAKDGTSTVDDAKSILAENGVTYTNLMSTEEVFNVLALTAFPTTYFVDSEGKILTDPVVGANFSGYREAIEEALAVVGE